MQPASALNENYRSYVRSECAVFRKTHERFGGLSNMASGFGLVINGTRIKSSEALYQACRFPHRPEVQRLIIEQDSPMTAKMKSKPYRFDSRRDWETVRVSVMRWCLRVKLVQNWSKFGDLLISTGPRPIVEESRKDDFWGAKPTDENVLWGQNVLGRLLMELREKLRSKPESLRTIQPLQISNFSLLGRAIPTLSVHMAPRQAWEEQPALPMAAQSIPPAAEDLPHKKGTRDLENRPRTKLIEVALPLPEINDASAYDKMPGIGPHPKGIHHWWARLPLPVARAVLFASVVDDPSEHPEKWRGEAEQNAERERLFEIIRKMMGKRMHKHREVYAQARAEMLKHCNGRLPTVFDPFAGGGSIPIESNRLGFETYAGDLNPVAVLLNKCNLELLPHCANQSPVNPEDRRRIGGTEAWRGSHGLAADLRYYGRVIRDRMRDKIGHLYPSVRLPKEYGGATANAISWIWARTVASPNPAAQGSHIPLISTYWLSNKKGSEAWLRPVVDKVRNSWRFDVRTGSPEDRAVVRAGTKIGRAQFRCLLTGAPVTDEHIKAEGLRGHLGISLVAVVAEGKRRRVFLPATASDVDTALSAQADNAPGDELVYDSRYLTPPGYGLRTIDRLFTPRQLTAMTVLSGNVKAIRQDVQQDAEAAGLAPNQADAYARVVTTFLALALDRCADFNNTLCRWSPSNQKVMNLFGRQAIPMVWDFAEANILGDSVGAWSTCSEYVAECVEVIGAGSDASGNARQIDAASGANGVEKLMVSTDPPYYDNVPYADISDFFYVWLRRTIGDLYPDLFSTMLAPKMAELTASPRRFDGDKEKAKEHFEKGFRKAFAALRDKMDVRFPLTVYYAFKQDDEEISGAEEDVDRDGSVSIDLTTGWETMLEALVGTRFQIVGTWPVRASQKWRMRAMGSNALASYIVLACRPRQADAPNTDRRSFLTELKRDLPPALRHLQQGNIAPVDLAQAALGPGMAIYSRYAAILEASGKPMTVRAALREINRVLDETLAEQEGDMDADTRFCVAWFEQYGTDERAYGEAEVLFTAKNTSFAGLERAGVIVGGKGKVRLRRRNEMDATWDPRSELRLTDWECVQQLVRAMTAESGGGVAEAARLVVAMGPARAENSRTLAYRLFNVSERKGWADEALAYNILVTSWPQIQAEAAKLAAGGPMQPQLAL